MNRTNIPTLGLSNCYIAGGAVLSHLTKQDVNDYDVYPKSEEAFYDALATLNEDDCFIINLSSRAVTLKSNIYKNSKGERQTIQVIYNPTWFSSPETIFDKFDFSVCMVAFDTDTKTLHTHPDFLQSVASKDIVFNPNTSFPLASLARVKKYTDKGYSFPKTELIKLGLAVSNAGKLESWKDLADAIGGFYGVDISIKDEDMPFSYEAAYEFLDTFVPEAYYKEKSYSYDEDLIRAYYDKTPIDVIRNVNTFSNKHHRIIRTVDIYTGEEHVRILSDYSDSLDNFSDKLALNFYTGMVRGYKKYRISEKDPNILLPGVMQNSTFETRIGEFVTCDTSPYLHVAKCKRWLSSNYHPGKNAVIHEVEFHTADIVEISHNEIRVKRLRIIPNQGVNNEL